MRRTQLYLDDEQYRWLKRQAGPRGSIAAVVRELIDNARKHRRDAREDPLIKHLLLDPPVDGMPGNASSVDRDVYGG